MAEVKVTPKTPANGPKGKEVGRRAGAEAPAAWQASPFGVVRRFAEEMDRLFEDFGVRGLGRFPNVRELMDREMPEIPAAWAPRIEVRGGDGKMIVRADLPGMDKDDIKVEVTGDRITIQGERKEERKEEREGHAYTECSYGRFYRAIPLPAGAEADKATADFKNGVLEVTIPTPAPSDAQPRRLDVRAKA